MTRAPKSARDPATALDRHLGRCLARRRRRVGKTAAELDEAIAAPGGSVAAFERGAKSMDAGHLFGLSRALGVPVAYFFEDLPDLPGPGPAPESGRIREAERFIDAYFRISDRRLRRDIRSLMKAMGGGSDRRA